MKRFEPPLLFALFLDLVGFGIMFPDIQLRAQEYGAPGWLIGLTLASYYLVQMAASPFWGRLSDRIGRKPVLLVCGGLSALSMAIYAFSANIGWIVVSRILAGLGGANVAVAQAYIADAADPEQRAGALGRMSAAISAGLVLGPSLGGFLAQAGGNFLLGIVAALASGIGVLWIMIAVPSLPPRRAGETPSGDRIPAIALFRGNPPLFRLFAVAVTGWFALACLEGTFGRLIQHNLGYGRLEFGILLSLEAGVAVIQGAIYPFLAKRLCEETLLRIAYVLQTIGLGLMPFAPDFPSLVVLSIAFGFGVGIANPTINSRASHLVSPERQGSVFGLLQSSRAFGFLVGPMIGGTLFDWNSAAPYLLGGATMLLAAFAVRSSSPPAKRI